MTDSLADAGDALARQLQHRVSHGRGTDLAAALGEALSGYSPDDAMEEAEETITRQPAVDPTQGSGNLQSNRHYGDELTHVLAQAVGLA